MTSPDITLGLSIEEAKRLRRGEPLALFDRLQPLIAEYERAQEPVYEFRVARGEGVVDWSAWRTVESPGGVGEHVEALLAYDHHELVTTQGRNVIRQWRRRP